MLAWIINTNKGATTLSAEKEPGAKFYCFVSWTAEQFTDRLIADI